MRPRMTAAGGLQVGVALVYGALLGSWLPLPSGQPVFALPAAVVTSPLPRDLQARPEHPPAAGWAARPAGHAAGGTWFPDASETFADTLPAAPSNPVAPLAGRPPASAGLARAGGAPAAARRSVATCPAIIVEGSSVAPECRTATQRRLRSLCPLPGDPRHAGPIVCIRAEH